MDDKPPLKRFCSNHTNIEMYRYNQREAKAEEYLRVLINKLGFETVKNALEKIRLSHIHQ